MNTNDRQQLNDALRLAHRAYAAQVRRTLASIKEAFAPVGEWMQTPEGQAQLAEWRRQRQAERIDAENLNLPIPELRDDERA